MALTPISNFFKYVVDDVHTAPKVVVTKASLAVLISFLEQTKILKVTADAITPVVSTREYSLSWDSGTSPYRLVAINKAYTSNDVKLQITTDEEMDKTQGSAWYTKTGTISHVLPTIQGTLNLYPIPNDTTTGDIYISGPVTLTRSATEIEEWVLDTFVEDIVNGIKAKVLRQPGKTWTNIRGAQHFSKMYARAIRKVRRQTVFGKGAKSGTVAPASFKYLGKRLD